MFWERIKLMFLMLPLLPSMVLAQGMGGDTARGDTGTMGGGGGMNGMDGGMEGDGAMNGVADGGITAWGWFWIVVIALAVVLLVWMFAQSGRRRGQPGT
jgi:hypothetical protein